MIYYIQEVKHKLPKRGEGVKDWVQLITALIQSITALIILKQNCRKKKKGTNRRRGQRKR